IGTLFPYVFLSKGMMIEMIIITALQSFSLAGALYHVDIIHGDIIDEDELKTGVRRAGSYYGINAFIHRFSTIAVISSIALVFTGAGWAEYEPQGSINVILGLKIIIFLFPAISMILALIFLKIYKIHGTYLEKIRTELKSFREK
ncbi:MAG: MFS transporter, partial [Promethearchaeota archaeon]